MGTQIPKKMAKTSKIYKTLTLENVSEVHSLALKCQSSPALSLIPGMRLRTGDDRYFRLRFNITVENARGSED